ncbi:hypothetical protein VHUM_02278 [Vanrija humicola]|uniref:Uncharacterized protein n=1 Tax=Vanrija humicola TaxID=5417 RepID=A0A7D8V250_VANHU|nr:hypothetical protein VHUM_02278 [Vanrija humicola]
MLTARTAARTIARTAPRRALSTSAALREEAAAAAGTVGAVPVQKPLLGFSAATSLGVYYLQQDTKIAQGLLLASVDELSQGTERITSHLDRLQTVEKDLAALRAQSAASGDVAKVRAEMKKVYDGLHLELLDLRAHVWGVEQDLQKVAKTGTCDGGGGGVFFALVPQAPTPADTPQRPSGFRLVDRKCSGLCHCGGVRRLAGGWWTGRCPPGPPSYRGANSG